VGKEFVFYRATGHDGQGTVGFTGYFEPTYPASRTPTAQFRYPLFQQPAGFSKWPKPHPTRLQLEGQDGLQASRGLLKGTELVWLGDRMEAYLVQVQGSARLSLPNGQSMSVGYDGHTDYPYISLGKELIKDGKFRPEELTLPKLVSYFQANPAQMNQYFPRNQRFVFFRNTQGALPMGSINVPVTAERSIATDKSRFPPGALALIRAPLPNQQLTRQDTVRFVLDQDTGGAIKGPGRVDVFMGSGKLAGDRAGLINSPGALYYLLLK
jgi:membrane-bound lytic murein transglycosylase A